MFHRVEYLQPCGALVICTTPFQLGLGWGVYDLTCPACDESFVLVAPVGMTHVWCCPFCQLIDDDWLADDSSPPLTAKHDGGSVRFDIGEYGPPQFEVSFDELD